MECHRDEVVVRVSSIYDSLIGHGSTSALLEGGADSEIMWNTLYRETHNIVNIKATQGISCYRCKICQSIFCIMGMPVHTYPVGKRYSHNIGMSSANSSACFLFELSEDSRWRICHPEASSGYKSFWSKDPEFCYCSHVYILQVYQHRILNANHGY